MKGGDFRVSNFHVDVYNRLGDGANSDTTEGSASASW